MLASIMAYMLKCMFKITVAEIVTVIFLFILDDLGYAIVKLLNERLSAIK